MTDRAAPYVSLFEAIDALILIPLIFQLLIENGATLAEGIIRWAVEKLAPAELRADLEEELLASIEANGSITKLCQAIIIVFYLPATIRARQGLPTLLGQLEWWTDQTLLDLLFRVDQWSSWLRGQWSVLISFLRNIGRPATHTSRLLGESILSMSTALMFIVLVFSHVSQETSAEHGNLPMWVQVALAVVGVGGLGWISYRSLVVFIYLERRRTEQSRKS